MKTNFESILAIENRFIQEGSVVRLRLRFSADDTPCPLNRQRENNEWSTF